MVIILVDIMYIFSFKKGVGTTEPNMYVLWTLITLMLGWLAPSGSLIFPCQLLPSNFYHMIFRSSFTVTGIDFTSWLPYIWSFSFKQWFLIAAFLCAHLSASIHQSNHVSTSEESRMCSWPRPDLWEDPQPDCSSLQECGGALYLLSSYD